MKKILFALSLSVSVFAAPKALISKTSGGGFMAPEYAGYERCDVYADKVVLTHQYGMVRETALQLVEERNIKLSGDVATVIEKARAEQETTKPNNLCDGPSTSITANPAQGEAVVLFSTGGCGSPEHSRDGVYSSKLKNIVNVYCPQTYKFSNP